MKNFTESFLFSKIFCIFAITLNQIKLFLKMKKLKELYTTKEKFCKYTEEATDINKIFGRYYDFNNWLLQKMSETTDAELLAHLTSVQLSMIDKCIRWTNNENIKEKDFARNWNSSLIRKVCDTAETWDKINNTELDTNKTFLKWIAETVNELLLCDDYATVVYCFKVLERKRFINLKDLQGHVIEHYRQAKQKENTFKTMEQTVIPRLKVNGDLVYDYTNKLYYHWISKDEMTFNECLERGLSVTYLGTSRMLNATCYPPESKQTSLLIGFADPTNAVQYNTALKQAEAKKKQLQKLVDKQDEKNLNDYMFQIQCYNKLPKCDETLIDKRPTPTKEEIEEVVNSVITETTVVDNTTIV